jgi:hypothetical protein
MIELKRPCSVCYEANSDVLVELQRDHHRQCTTALHDKPLPGIPAPGPTEGQPPTYQEATEQPPTYDRAISEEEPATYDNVITAMATFQPEEILRAWHTFRATQLSLLPPLLTELQALEHRVFKAKRRLHRAEDIGFCEEVIIRLAREQHTLDKSLQQGQRYCARTEVSQHHSTRYTSSIQPLPLRINTTTWRQQLNVRDQLDLAYDSQI